MILSRYKSGIASQTLILSTSPDLTEDNPQKSENLKNLLDELMGVLEVEIDQYHECLNLLHEQQEKIIAGNAGVVEEIGKRQNTMILKIKTLEEARKSIVSKLAQYFGGSVGEFTLKKLAELVENPYSEWCMAYQSQILVLIEALEKLKGSNAYLIQHTLHYINGVLKIFASIHTADAFMEAAYSKRGLLEIKTERGKRVSGRW